MSRVPVEAAVAEVNGTRLYYESRGSGPAILLLHGFTLDHRMWNRQVDVLAERHRVVTYDARGFGRSALPTSDPYMHCADAAALCEHLGLSGVTAVGHSIGGLYALELAITRPDLVAGWVAVCMAGLSNAPFPDDIQRMFASLREAAAREGLDAAKRIWARSAWFTATRESPELERELDVMLADYSGWHWTHQNPAQNIVPPASERLGAVRVPTLIITGSRDLPYTARIGEELARGVGGAAQLRLEGAGHMANMEDPDTVNRAIAAHVDAAIAR